ncbi:MAG: ATP-dependent Clp protease ATP-binding subunit [Clostridia bacterium]|nr:ATP-dependent Clp protease ATP-binding subunit [Clostridia bacterium]
MELCSRCKKRVAVVYITRMDGEKTINEGICIKCAKELGIKPVNDIIQNMGLSDEDLDRMDLDMGEIISQAENPDNSSDSSEILGKTPPIDMNRLFNGIFPNMKGQQSPNGVPPVNKNARKQEGKEKKFLSMYCTDLTKQAREGKLDRIIGRERELSRLMQILCRRQKNNPCLIGEPGVGKTAIAESLAMAISNGNVPVKLSGKEVHLVDMTSLVAGTQFRGQFESRMKGLIEESKNLGNIILVIDEIHSIVGAGDSEGSMNAANILKPALSRGEIQIIGATTLTEYRKYIEKDSALERRFQPIIVEEPSVSDTIEIMKGIKGYYEKFHGVKIPDETVERAVVLSERYITDRFLPDKAIDLIDEAAAYMALTSPEINRAEKASLALAKARKELEIAANDESEPENVEEKYEKIAELKEAEAKAEKEFEEASAERDKVVLDTKELAQVIEIWTGIPASSITESEFRRVEGLAERLKKRIVGQDKAVDAVARAIKRNRAGVTSKRRPVSFIFAGPTGVGKTELVKTLANDLFDSPETLIRLDMSEFMEKFSVSRIIGAPPGYVGYEEAGQLTEKIRRKPYSVVLFDEIEKAHPDVMNILLQILDEGQITDASGRKVNFENTVIIMTTNTGAVGVDAVPGFTSVAGSAEEGKTMKALEQFLRPEFINRVDEIITFNSLTEEDFVEIAKIQLSDLAKTLAEKSITLHYTDSAAALLSRKAYSRKFGARNLRRTIEREIEDVLATKLISDYNGTIRDAYVDADNENLVISCI